MESSDQRLVPMELIAELLARRESDVYRTVIAEVDRLLLAEVMKRCVGNQSAASQFLGLSRMTLRAKLRSLRMLR